MRVQKSHDFHLNEPIFGGNDFRYVVLIRNPVDAIISWWKLLLLTEPNRIDSREQFEKFFQESCQFWNGFCQKWIVPAQHVSRNEANNKLVYVTYEEMVADKNLLTKAVKLLIPQEAHYLFDLHKDVIEKSVVPPSENARNFEYHGADLIATARNILSHDLISMLNISI